MMKTTQKRAGFIVYEKDRDDLLQDAILAMAKMDVQLLSDEEAASFGVLFAQWTAGEEYLAGARISDEEGNLYKVVQDHTAQADFPIESTTSLYTPLRKH